MPGTTMLCRNIPELAAGERYVASISNLNSSQPMHIILLPNNGATGDWETQMHWAKNCGGCLPNRVELAILWTNYRHLFKGNVYWSCDEFYWLGDHSHGTGFAWSQDFKYGHQNNYHKSTLLRAFAVRRIVTQPSCLL